MYKPQLALHYLYYWLTAKHVGGHQVHSPLVFDFITQVLDTSRHYYAFAPIEQHRNRLLRNTHPIVRHDLGAGSALPTTTTVAHIAKRSLVSPRWGQVLFRTALQYGSRSILELGSSLGISTAYLAAPDSRAQVHSIEGCPQTASVAQHSLQQLKLPNATVHQGSFEAILPELLPKLDALDMVYFDGNHRYEPTVRYFQQVLPYLSESAVLVWDDIRWSKEMQKAWKYVCAHESTIVTIDLFFVGLAFVRPHTARQHFVVKF